MNGCIWTVKQVWVDLRKTLKFHKFVFCSVDDYVRKLTNTACTVKCPHAGIEAVHIYLSQNSFWGSWILQYT